MEVAEIASLPAYCMLCKCESSLLFCTDGLGFVLCGHIFCTPCFTKNNANNNTQSLKCPVCQGPYYYSISSLEEAIMIGEGGYCNVEYFRINYNNIYNSDAFSLLIKGIKIFEKLIELFPDSISGLIFLIYWYSEAVIAGEQGIRESDDNAVSFIEKKANIMKYAWNCYQSCMRLLDMTSHESSFLFTSYLEEYYLHMGHAFQLGTNYYMCVKYYKLAYDEALRAGNHPKLNEYKEQLSRALVLLSDLPSLRFAVGEEVECLDLGSGGGSGEWLQGNIIEQHYRERDSPLNYCAPYRVLVSVLTEESTVHSQSLESDAPGCRYIVVEDDSDAHIRKPGKISIEETRYESRLDAKVAELARLYCSKEFIADMFSTLSEDEEFCTTLFYSWQLELSVPLLYLYRILIMYRQPLVRTDTGYHVPTSEEVVAGIRAFFNPTTPIADLEARVLADTATDIERVKVADCFVLRLPGKAIGQETFNSKLYLDARLPEASLTLALTAYLEMYIGKTDNVFTMASVIESGFSISLPSFYSPSSEALQLIAGARSARQLSLLYGQFNAMGGSELFFRLYLHALDALNLAGSATAQRECPHILFFVKYCLEQGLTVPSPLLAVYNNMRIQLSCSFLRCARPGCEHSKLELSSGEVKFKKCSRCLTVIYCSRECQVTHYPAHKKFCLTRG